MEEKFNSNIKHCHRAFCLFTHLILTLTLLGRNCYRLPFTNEETEAREFKDCQNSHYVMLLATQ